MEDFLRKIKLLDHFTIVLNVSKTDFIKKFRAQVDYSDLSISDSFFEVFSSSKNDYKGNTNDSIFRLRRRRKFFDTNRNFAVVEGKLVEKSDALILETDIKGYNKQITIILAFFIVFYFLCILGCLIFSLNSSESSSNLLIIPFLIFHASFMIGIPYFIMRRSVKRMKYELERDFYFWIK